MKLFLSLLMAFLLLASFSATLWAQLGNASITGQIKDQTGAVIPGATVSLKNTATNVSVKTETNADGRYFVGNLIPGAYTLTAEFSGFKNLERGEIVLQVGDRLGLDLNMELGQASERITVTGEVPLLRTEDVQTGLVIDNRRIQELPQYSRDVLAFALLTPNVQTGPNGSTEDLRINGGRTGQTEYFLDGVPMTTGYDHSVPDSIPSREAIGEFKVITNGMSAEYGRLSGGAVVMITKSGGNRFHGSAYEFFRNDKLNANDWNSNRFGSKKGVFHDNVFGASLGGPLRVPKVYDGRDKTFFFFNYEGTRRNTGTNAVTTGVPTALERRGDFSQSLIDRGAAVQIFDPLTGVQEGTRVRRSPFAGNRIPESRFDPMAKLYLSYYPEANRPSMPNSSHDQNYIGSVSNPYSNDRWTGRLDQNWNSRHVTHVTVTRFDDKSSSPRWFSALQSATVNYSTAHTVSLDHTYTLTPTTLLNVRAGVLRRSGISGSEVLADASGWPYQREVLNLLGATQNRVPNLGTNDTIFNLGGGATNNTFDTNYTAAVSVQKIWGKQTLKLGYEHRRYYTNLTTGGSMNITTDRRITSQYYDDASTGSGFASWLLGIANWGEGTQLAGPASLQPYHGAYVQDDIRITSKLTVNLGVRWDFEPPRSERFDRQIVWDQDYKWNWTPNPGWSWNAVQQQAGITFAQPSWLTNGIYGRAAMLGTSEYPMRTWQKEYPYHFGPRIGFAYRFVPRTVFRAGYGLNWLTMTGDRYLNTASLNTGYGDKARLMQDGTADNGLTYPLSFTVPMPGGTGYVPFTRDVDALNRSTLGNWFVIPATDMYPGYEHVLVASLQREFGSGDNTWVVEAAYNGNLGRDLPFNKALHSVPDAYHVLGVPLGNALNTNVDNPFYGQVPDGTTMGGKQIPLARVLQLHPLWREVLNWNQPRAWSNYHSGYLQVEHRFARGFSLLGNYTFGKLLQAGGSIGADRSGMHSAGATTGDSQGYPQAELPMNDIYGLAPFDVTHAGVVNGMWEIPFGRGRKLLSRADSLSRTFLNAIVGGWNVGGTMTMRGGSPFALVCGGSYCRNWIGIGQGRHTRPRFADQRVPYANDVSGHQALEGAANQVLYLVPSGFRVVRDMEIGDVGSTLQGVRGPGFSQFDFSLSKNFSLGGEQRYLQFRFESENLLNHMNARNPDNAITSRTFGMITGQNGNPRRIIIAAKLYF